MFLKKIAAQSVVTASPSVTVSEIASLMQEGNVGSVVLLDRGRPCGIVTDRDLLPLLSGGPWDPHELRVDAIMSRDLVVAAESMEAVEAAALMREHQVRRLPVVDAQGKLVGLVTLDAVLRHVGDELSELANSIVSFPIAS